MSADVQVIEFDFVEGSSRCRSGAKWVGQIGRTTTIVQCVYDEHDDGEHCSIAGGGRRQVRWTTSRPNTRAHEQGENP